MSEEPIHTPNQDAGPSEVEPVGPNSTEDPYAEFRPNIYFKLAAGAAALFVITILAFVANIFGDENAPPGQFLNRHGGLLLMGEVVAAVTLGFMAMAADRRDIRTRKAAAEALISDTLRETSPEAFTTPHTDEGCPPESAK